MVTYKYTALSRSGQKVSGVMEGMNELDAVDRIKQEYAIVLKLTEVKDKKDGILNMDIGGKKLNAKAFTVMCSQFAIILKAGIPIARTMHLVADKTTDKTLHNGDGLCFLSQDNELIGIRADVVTLGRDGVRTVSTNRPHGAHRGARIYRNYDLEWQKQVEASAGNRKIDINLTLAETETGYEMVAVCRDAINRVSTSVTCEKITATNPEKATENIWKKALQWGDTSFNPINLELQFAEPRLIPASVIGEMKRQLVEKLINALIENHRENREIRCTDTSNVSVDENGRTQCGRTRYVPTIDPDAIPDQLMTCHHCIRYANGMCSKETGQKATDLFLRHGAQTFRLVFDCRHCLMYVQN